jgi:hypothetical protein
VALLEKRRYLNNRSGDFPQVILIVPSHVPNICGCGCVIGGFDGGWFRKKQIFFLPKP